jgi:hypothetical protein
MMATNGAMLVGAGLLAWSAAIHLDLWHGGYRNLPTIGPLFLLQTIVGFLLAAAVAGARRTGPALAGAGFLASTIGGLILSAQVGLFGFQDSYSAPFAEMSLLVESAGIAVLVAACGLRAVQVRQGSQPVPAQNAER